MIDKADERAVEEVAGQDRGEKRGEQTGAAIEGERRERPDRGDGQHAHDRRRERGHAFDIGGWRARPARHEHHRRHDGVEQRRDRHELAVRPRVGIDGDVVREVADLVLDQADVIPGVGLEEVDAVAACPERSRGAEYVAPRRPDPQACRDRQDDDQKNEVGLSH